MNKLFLLFSFLMFATGLFAGTINKPVKSQYGFIENKGQIIDQNHQLNSSVLYLYNGNGLHVQLKQSGFSYEVWKVKGAAGKLAVSHQPLASGKSLLPEASSQQPAANSANTTDSIYIHRIDITFVGANQNAKITSFDPSSDYINYYTTGTSEAGVTNVHHFKKVLYQNIYPNIDVEFVLNENKFKYNFIIHPGGNPNDIQLKFDGANNTSLTNEGHITIETAYGNIDESIPYSYQLDKSNQQQEITANFKQQTSNLYGISVGTYDINKTLIIDPAPWATYYGGSSNDEGYAITTDVSGNVYITGLTYSTNAIATSGSYQNANYGANADAFITMLTSSGTIVWGTYYGATGTEWGNAITVDAANSLYIAGSASSTNFNYIATSNGFQTTYGGGASDGFVVKFDSLGIRKWGTYYGTDSIDVATGIAIDAYANVYITGYTHSLTGISTSGAFQISKGGNTDAFVVKFDSSGARKWGTYYGGTNDDNGYSIAIDSNGFVNLTGNTLSVSGIASSGAFSTSFLGGRDAFIVRFDSVGIRQWATYFGGTSDDLGLAISTDFNQNIYITGGTNSNSGIATTGAFQTILGSGNYDAYIAKFNSSGSLQWATYYGNGWTYGSAISIDLIGNILLSGGTTSSFGIATSGAFQTSFSGGSGGDAYIAKFTSSGSRLWATYFGGIGGEDVGGVATDASNNVYLTGMTTSTSGIVTSGARQPTFGGGYDDAFITKFTSSGALINVSNDSISGTQNICNGAIPSTLTGSTPTGGNGTYKFKWQKSTVSATNGFINAGGNDTSQNYSPSALITNTWYRRALASGGSYDTTAAIAITIKLRAGFTINNANQCFAGNSFIFSDTTLTTLGTLTRKWYFGAGVNDTSILVNPTKVYSSFGTYQIKLVSIGSNGCADSVTKIVTVYPKPSVGFTINSTLQQCFVGNNFGFTDTSSISNGTLTRLWSFSNTNNDTSTLISLIKVFSTYGTKNIKLIISNNGCKDSVTKAVTVYPNPQVLFAINNLPTGQAGSTQCLNGNNFGFTDYSIIGSGTMQRIWSFGTGNNDTSTTANPTKIYNSANTYTVKLVQISNNGCKDSTTKTATVYSKPIVGFTINNVNQCLVGNNFSFSDTSSILTGTITRLWNFGNGDTATVINSTKSYSSANSYSVKLLETSDNGCMDSVIKTVNVNPKPSVGFTINNTSQCINGNNFLFTDTTIIISGTYTRQWNFGTGINDTSTSNSSNKVYTIANTYSVKLFVNSNYGCKDSITKTVIVNPKPNVGFTINNITQCLNGNNFLFSDTSKINGSTLTRKWNFGTGISDTSLINNPSKIYGNVNSYQVKLVSISNNNCKDSLTKMVIVVQPKSGFTINNTSQCLIGNSFSFDDTTSTTISRLWDLGDLTTNTNDTFSKTYSNAGTYNVKLKVNDAHSCSDSITKVVTVKSSPAKPMVSAITNSLLQSTVANSYQWYLNNSIISSATNQTLAIITNGNYFVLIDSTNGCSNLSNLFAASSVGIAEINISQNEIKIYPNPATQELFISFLSPQNTNTILIEVIDVKGSKLMSFNETIQTGKPLSIDINDLAEGMYFVMVNNKAYKFVKTDK